MKITEKMAHMSEDEFRAMGGSQVTVDLAKLAEERVTNAIRSVAQLALTELDGLAIHSNAVMAAATDHYVFVCCKDGVMHNPDDYISAIMDGVKTEIEKVFAQMTQKDKDGKTRFESVRDGVEKAFKPKR